MAILSLLDLSTAFDTIDNGLDFSFLSDVVIKGNVT